MVTPDHSSENFSPDYYNFVKLRVLESPLKLSNNPFFPENSLLINEDTGK